MKNPMDQRRKVIKMGTVYSGLGDPLMSDSKPAVHHVTDGVRMVWTYAVVQLSPRRFQVIRSCTKHGNVAVYELVDKPTDDSFYAAENAKQYQREQGGGGDEH